MKDSEESSAMKTGSEASEKSVPLTQEDLDLVCGGYGYYEFPPIFGGESTPVGNAGILNVSSNGPVITGTEFIGSVSSEGGSIHNCENYGAVSGETCVGGLCGKNDGKITNNSNYGPVSR